MKKIIFTQTFRYWNVNIEKSVVLYSDFIPRIGESVKTDSLDGDIVKITNNFGALGTSVTVQLAEILIHDNLDGVSLSLNITDCRLVLAYKNEAEDTPWEDHVLYRSRDETLPTSKNNADIPFDEEKFSQLFPPIQTNQR